MSTHANRWMTVIVLLLAIVPFAPSLGNGFALDGEPLASSHFMRAPDLPDPVIAELQAPGFYFSKSYWYPESVNDGLYRPVTIYSFALVYWLFGQHLANDEPRLEAVPQHVVNVLLHALASLFVLLLLRTIGLGPVAAQVGAGCFAVHAIHSEVVAGVVGRAELLAAVFGLGAILLFVRGLDKPPLGRRLGFATSAVLMFLAYGAKESAVACGPFLFCVLLAIYWDRHSHLASRLDDSRLDIRTTSAAVAVVTLVPLAVFLALRHGVMTDPQQPLVEAIDYVANPLYHYDLLTRLCTAVKILGFGLYKCVAPIHLSASYGAAVFEPTTSLIDPGFLAATLVLGSWLFLGLRLARRVPALFIATATFFGFAFLTSNLPFAIGTTFAERLYYLPSLGVCILAALLVEKLHRRRSHQVALGLLAVWASVNLAIAWPRNFAWRDTPTLCLLEAENQPNSAGMLVKAASILRLSMLTHPTESAAAGDRALRYLERALDRVPGYPHALREKAALHLQRRQFDAALAATRAAIDSDYEELADAKIFSHNTLVDIWVRKGDRRRAVQAALATLRIAPLDGASWAAVAQYGPDTLPRSELATLFQRGYAAQRQLPKIIGHGVSSPEVGLHLGIMGERIEADPRTVSDLIERSAEQLDPTRGHGKLLANAFFHLGRANARAGQPAVARRLLQKLLSTPTLPADLRPKITAALRQLPDK